MQDVEKVPCVDCGAMILPRTAEKYDNKCATCSRKTSTAGKHMDRFHLFLAIYSLSIGIAMYVATPPAPGRWLFIVVLPILVFFVCVSGFLFSTMGMLAAAIAALALSASSGLSIGPVVAGAAYLVAGIARFAERLIVGGAAQDSEDS